MRTVSETIPTTDTPVNDTINIIERSLIEAMLGISPQERTRITLDIAAALCTAGLLKTLPREQR